MYFPFLRGKQFELIALREMSDIISQHSNKISPIIEPVKTSFSTLRLTIEQLINSDINFTLILNPIVGELNTNNSLIVEYLNQQLEEYNNFQIGFYIYNQDSVNNAIHLAREINVDFDGFTLIHSAQIPNLDGLSGFSDINNIKYNLINSSRVSRRYHRNFDNETRVVLDDYFNLLSRNSDYLNIPDEPFSDEHLYYIEDGYIGFSDYLTVGEPYAESGFLPYAVVIHLTYPLPDNTLNIRHFVSDSNDDTSDVAGKFSEALDKLIEWLDSTQLNSRATEEFRQLHDSGHFPGLGYNKKLSLMHHIEIITNLI
jgi:hypothetical protein